MPKIHSRKEEPPPPLKTIWEFEGDRDAEALLAQAIKLILADQNAANSKRMGDDTGDKTHI